MKKLLTLMMVVMVSLTSFAQKDVTKFLGIPVDGTVSEMRQKLIDKGFESLPGFEYNQLKGRFNGEDVLLSIAENNGKVWRIALGDANPSSETNVRIRFNNLCHQFCNNKNYIALQKEDDYMIPDDADIAYDMIVKKKRYDAIFMQAAKDTANINKAMWNAIYSKYTEEQVQNPTEAQQADILKIGSEARLVAMKETIQKRVVWFMIGEDSGKYIIQMYYENGHNQANGEDL